MVVATVVLFHPNLELLERLLTSMAGQVDRVVAVDNTPGLPGISPAFWERFPYRISHIALGENKGIAEAQNVGIRQSIRDGCSHVLLLDQDSAPSPGLVSKLLAAEMKLLKAGKQVAAVGPQYVDEKTGTPSCAVRHGCLTVRRVNLDPRSDDPVETDNLIASGSLTRVDAFRSVGMMREDLFIDFVDTEWGLRARSKGYKSYCVPDAIMMHSTGDAAIRIFGKEVYVHSDVRRYYRLRNAVFLLRLRSMGWQWRSYISPRIPYYILLYVWLSERKLRNTGLMLKALRDGLSGRLGPLREKWITK